MSRIVVALGGNALGKTPAEQLDLARQAAASVADLVEAGHQVIVTHGNGPQVGMIKTAFDFSMTHSGRTPDIPFAECGAMSQGYIGYHLQQSLRNQLHARGKETDVVTIVTQTQVNSLDPAFDQPTKPVGAFFTEAEARRMMAETGRIFAPDAGRGWRWVVASPQPVSIVEASAIHTLVSNGAVVIAAGGDGVPVAQTDSGMEGRAAVIDKDQTAALLASLVNADTLLILTAVDQVAINFNTPQQQNLAHMTVKQAHLLMEAGHFAAGSMLAKVQACLSFVEGKPARRAIIASLLQAGPALAGQAGTTIAEQ